MVYKAASDASFERDVLGAGGPVLVDFGAEWCPPCKVIEPLLRELAQEMGDRVAVVTVDVDASPLFASRYGVRGLPTLMLFKGGEVAATKVGAAPKSVLAQWLESAL